MDFLGDDLKRCVEGTSFIDRCLPNLQFLITNICRTSKGCKVDAHCPAAAPACNHATDRCVQCLDDGDCPGGDDNVCHGANNTCSSTAATANCPPGSSGGNAQVCYGDNDCPASEPVCSGGACRECGADGDCRRGYCAAGGSCRSQCPCGHGKRCDPSRGRCLRGCGGDHDCTAAGEERCNPDM